MRALTASGQAWGGLLGGIVTPGSGYVRPKCRLEGWGSGREVGDGPFTAEGLLVLGARVYGGAGGG